MKIIKSDLHAIAVGPSQYPKDDLPEIAFAGRSNVGKSSFINSMINRANLARTSGKPGKTRTINFYIINDSFRFVDLPGYGYAHVSKSEREKWGIIIDEYLTTRENLKEIVLVVDIRHEPSEQDLMMYNWIKHFGFNGIVNEHAAEGTKLQDEDIDLMVKAIWNGTKNLISRSKVGQMPRLLLKVNYVKDSFHIGDLLKDIKLKTKLNDEEEIRNIDDFTLNLDLFMNSLNKYKKKIESIEFAVDDRVKFKLNDNSIKLEEALNEFNPIELKIEGW